NQDRSPKPVATGPGWRGKGRSKKAKGRSRSGRVGFYRSYPARHLPFPGSFCHKAGSKVAELRIHSKGTKHAEIRKFGLDSDGRSARLPSVKYHRRLACLLLNAERR